MNPSISRYDKRQFRAPLAGLAALAVLAVSLLACGGSDDRASEDSSTALGSSGMATGGSFSPSAPDAPGANAARDGDFSGSRAESGAAYQLPGAAQTSAGEAQPIADVLGRQVIRNGSVELIVESVSDSFDEVRGVVDQAGGYLASSSFSGQDEFQRARLTVRVPAEKFDQVIADLRNLAVKVESVSTSSQDVTEEFSDLEASLRNLKAVEAQYLTLLGGTDNIGDILQVQDRLNGVRYELERVQGRLNLLENQTSLATLEIALFPDSGPAAQEPGTGFGAEVREAWQSSLDFIAAGGTALVVALVWSWWLIPVVIVAAFLLRRYAGRWARRTSSTPPTMPDRVDTPEGAA